MQTRRAGTAWAAALRRWRRQRPARNTQARREVERAALAGNALHPDSAVHQGDQPPTDGQAQSRAAEPARRRAVGLPERLEDQRLLLSRNADSRVAYLEMQNRFLIRDRLRLRDDFHEALLGELDRVSCQIQEHLAQPRGIAFHQ